MDTKRIRIALIERDQRLVDLHRVTGIPYNRLETAEPITPRKKITAVKTAYKRMPRALAGTTRSIRKRITDET